MRIATLLLVCSVFVVACGKSDALVGTWNGTEQMTDRQREGLKDMPADLVKKLDDTFAATKGTLVLNGDGSCTETNNYHGGHSWSGKWTHQGNAVTVALNGHETQDMTLAGDGKTLTYKGWTFKKG